MITTRIRDCALLALLLLPLTIWAQAAGTDTSASVQQTWKLLDYVATDYAGAVSGGAVVDEAEYVEQQEFSATVVAQLDRLPETPQLAALREQAQGLVQAVNAKVGAEEVAERAHALGSALLAAYPVPSAPAQAPDLAHGAAVYQQHCVTCHGAKGAGDGPAAAALDPAPIDFTDAARADLRSPLSLYQATSQGIEGTGMVGYAGTLSDADLWAVSYYVGTLAYAPQAGQGEAAWRNTPALHAHVSSLEELSQMRAGQLAGSFGQDTARALLGWLRQNPSAVLDAPVGIALARAKLAASLAAHKAGRAEEAVQLALSSYLDGVEPDEARLDTRDRVLRGRIESAMGAYRSALSDVVAMPGSRPPPWMRCWPRPRRCWAPAAPARARLSSVPSPSFCAKGWKHCSWSSPCWPSCTRQDARKPCAMSTTAGCWRWWQVASPGCWLLISSPSAAPAAR